MNQEMQFVACIEQIREIAKEQNNTISEEQLQEILEPLKLNEVQMDTIYQYLSQKNIGVGEPVEIEERLSHEDRNYLKDYEKELEDLPEISDGELRAATMAALNQEQWGKEQLLLYYLPRVIDIAKLYSGQGVLLEDLVGEGNVALATAVDMVGAMEEIEEVDGMIVKYIMNCMEEAIGQLEEERKLEEQVLDKVNLVNEKAKEMSEDLRRKVSLQELAEETGMTLEELEEAFSLSGSKIEYIENSN